MHLTTRLTAYPLASNKHVVCNAITGDILILDARGLRVLEQLRRLEAPTDDADIVEQLGDRQLVFPSAEDEDSAFRAACAAGRAYFHANAPRQYTFIVNTHCNFRCDYCFEEAFEQPAHTLTNAQVDAAFRIIDRYSARHARDRCPNVEIFGGEPLLPGSRGVLEHLMQLLAARNGHASVQTNGYFLADHVDFFERHRATIRQLQVTLDGPREVHDRRRVRQGGQPTFERIVAGIDLLRRRDIPLKFGIRMNVDRRNVAHLADMAELFVRLGWAADPRFNFVAAPVDDRCGRLRRKDHLLNWHEMFDLVFPLSHDSGAGPYDLSIFKIISYFRYYLQCAREARPERPQFIPKVHYCEAAALRLFGFHPDGRIYPCPETIGDERLAIGRYHPEFRVDRAQARKWFGQTIMKRARCRACSISTFCGGGCVLAAMARNGTADEPVCEQAPELMEAYFGQLRQASQ